EKIRTGIETHEFTSKENNEINVTASFGIKSFNPETPESMETIIIDAESALYKAKKSGKNQSVVFNNSKAGQIEYTILSNNNFTGKNETMLLLEAQEIDK
ncbi:MAG: diguanylate cyclase, partial [Spirochaetes bacterium]|nr:diguanylate cyclase [Spirochaetota bacterium]